MFVFNFSYKMTKAAPKKEVAKKVKKEKSAVKKPQSSFLIFSGENRARVQEENGLQKKDLGMTAKKLGELWKSLSDAEKDVYKQKAEALKAGQ